MTPLPSSRDSAALRDPVGGLPAAHGWSSWVVLAGVLLILAGGGHALEGAVALTGRADAQPPLLDLPAWGWVHVLLGAVMGLVGLGLLAGLRVARVCAVLFAAVSALGALASAAASPVTSAVLVALDVLVVYAVAVHGGDLRAPSYR